MVVTETHLFVATSRADLLVYLCCPTRRGGAHGYTAAQPKGDLTEGDILRSDRRVLKTHKSPTQGDMRIPIEACFTIKLTTAAAQKGTRISSSQGSWHLAGCIRIPPPLRPPCDRPVLLYRGTSRTAAARRARCTMPMGGIEHEACDAASSAMV